MSKIKIVAVIFQNNIQYESFKNAITIMKKMNITVDIFVPTHKYNDGFDKMFDEFYEKIIEKHKNINRQENKVKYDILFEPYNIPEFENLNRKYTIKYMYGLTTKPAYSLSLDINYIFDAFICYEKEDSESLNNYGKVFQVGDLKYINFKEKPTKTNKKKTILYLPTYGEMSSIESMMEQLLNINKKYNLLIKIHHGTEYLTNQLETSRREFIYTNFKKVYNSSDSLIELINKSDAVITDLSGAIFDAIYLKKPVIMIYNDDKCNYGDYTSLPVKYAQNGYIYSNKDPNNILEDLNKILNTKYIINQNKAINKLFCSIGNNIEKNFINMIKEIENDSINENFYLIHKNIKNEISNLLKENAYTNNLINNQKIQLQNVEQEINKYECKISELKNELKNNNCKINNIYNSTSWKITKPLRKFKLLIINLKKKY